MGYVGGEVVESIFVLQGSEGVDLPLYATSCWKMSHPSITWYQIWTVSNSQCILLSNTKIKKISFTNVSFFFLTIIAKEKESCTTLQLLKCLCTTERKCCTCMNFFPIRSLFTDNFPTRWSKKNLYHHPSSLRLVQLPYLANTLERWYCLGTGCRSGPWCYTLRSPLWGLCPRRYQCGGAVRALVWCAGHWTGMWPCLCQGNSERRRKRQQFFFYWHYKWQHL